MMSGFFTQAGVYLVTVVFEIYLLAVLLRFLFQLVRADFSNPVARFAVALTNPLLRPLRRVLPGVFGVDIASIVLLVVVKGVEIALLDALYGRAAWPAFVALRTVSDLLLLTINVYFFAVLLRVILSWVVPYGGRGNPVMDALMRLTEPLMSPARRLIPPIGGIDISPIAVIVSLRLLAMLVQHLFGFAYLSSVV